MDKEEMEFKKQCERRFIDDVDIRRFHNTLKAFRDAGRRPTFKSMKDYVGLSQTQAEFLAQHFKVELKS